MSITTRAAIARGPHLGWEIADLQLDEPKAHEVRVKLMAAGLCHSDDHITAGDAPVRMPVVGGHEGAGIVESVGPGVQRVKPGDKIVCSYIPACGACRPCSTGHSNMCVKGLNAGTGMFLDGTFRFHLGAEDLGGFCSLGTFSQYAVVSEWAARISRTSRGSSCAWWAAGCRPAGGPRCTRPRCGPATPW
jgi:Zn-dependent alcohol dehydrogenase